MILENGKIKLLPIDTIGKLRRYLDEGFVMETLCHPNREVSIESIKSVISDLYIDLFGHFFDYYHYSPVLTPKINENTDV